MSRFIESIKLRQNPPAEYKEEGSIWISGDRLLHKDYSSTTHTIAYVEDIDERSFVYVDPIAQFVHVIIHNLNSRNLLLSIQEDDGGFAGEYIGMVVFPTPGNEDNSITVLTDDAIKIHAVLMRP